MAKAFNQKSKILYLLQILSEQTDEYHVLNMQDILAALEEKGIRAERKSVYDDVDVLRHFGYDVCFRKGQPSGYYMGKRTFEIEEIETLIRLLPDTEDTVEIENKLRGLLSCHQAEMIQSSRGAESEEASQTVADEPFLSVDGKKEKLQLLFKEKHIPAVQAFAGDGCEVKEHKSGVYKAWVETVVDGQFYGWLVSQGFGIKVVKPKAEAEAYRTYLKKLLKQYK